MILFIKLKLYIHTALLGLEKVQKVESKETIYRTPHAGYLDERREDEGYVGQWVGQKEMIVR